MKGYVGRIAHIDLTSGQIGEHAVSDKVRSRHIGGKVLAAKIIHDAFSQRVDPFSEKNLLVVTTSPLNGSGLPCSSRFNVSTISPLTGLLTSSNCGGPFGLHLKRAGFDGLVIEGRSEAPVYLDIEDGKITVKDAKDLWGLTTSETQKRIQEEKKKGTLAIGPAGENLVRFAAVMSDERALGRGGIGAVFGHKSLKGMVASGTVQIDVADRKRLKKLAKWWVGSLQSHELTGKQLPTYGTGGLLSTMHFRGLLATRNHAAGSFEGFEKISGEALRENHLKTNKGCLTCPIRCERRIEHEGKTIKGPELETLTLLGSNLENDSLPVIIAMNRLADETGMDTISLGATLALAMELAEKNLWKNDLAFGKTDNLVKTVEQIARREGIGNLLAEGVRRLAERKGGRDFAMHVKGMEIAAYEPRNAHGMGLGYATASRGGCHLNAGYLVILEGLGFQVEGTKKKGKAAFAVMLQDVMEAVSAAGICLFTTYTMLPSFITKKPSSRLSRFINRILPSLGPLISFVTRHKGLLSLNMKRALPYPSALRFVTGERMTIGRFMRMGERGYNLERLVNLRQGLTKEADTLPSRHLESHWQEGKRPMDLSAMRKDYYRIRGWDEEGRPKKKTLKKLGFED